MQFRLQTLLLLFIVLWSSLAVFDVMGIGVVADVLLLAATLRFFRRPIVFWIVLVLLVLGIIGGLFFPLRSLPRELGFAWTRLAALPVWLLSVGVLLHRARRSRATVVPDGRAEMNE